MFCRQKRIVKRTNFDGSVDYVGQTKTFWGNWEDGYGPRTSKHYKTYKILMKDRKTVLLF